MAILSKRTHGFMIHFDGVVDIAEMETLAFQLRDEWAGMEEAFVFLIDARTFHIFTADAQALFEQLLEEALECGLVRTSVLAISTALAGLFCNIMVRTDVMPIYQYLDLAYEEDFRTEMENWLNEPFLEGADAAPEP